MKVYTSKHHQFLHGCDYNPEQWLQYPETLDQDIEYMKEAHCNVVSLGIFSWAFLEPEEGKYCFEYMDRIIERLTENDIQIILATPSGAKPRWLADKYPEVLRVTADGLREQYRARHNHCYTSSVYRAKAANIDRLLAERYGKNPNIILWHISNELGGECHCELCQKAFRDWLRQKYDNDLKKLNHAWWTGFWSHTVTDWKQIRSPGGLDEDNAVMPGLYIDWKHFVTYQTTEFMKVEIDAVNSIAPQIPVTTNFMGPYQHLDYHYMKDYLDVISWDSYPTWHSDRGDVYEAYSIAFAHDLHRCLKGKPFLLMESTPSLTNWLEYNKLKRPGMHRLSSLQAVAHGSDSVQYFQWRKGRGGSEKFHGAVIDHNGKAEGRVFQDVKNVGISLENLAEIAGSTVKSEIAVVYEFQNRWALENAQGFHNPDKKYKRTCINHYKEFWKRGINVDVIGVDKDFAGYKVLVLPMLYSISEESANRIASYVAGGGTVVATYMTGYVNETDLCHLGGFPGGKLKEVFGLTADEIDTLYPNEKNTVCMGAKRYEVIDYCELVTPNGAEVLGVYVEDFYVGKPAVLENQYGAGKAYYIACRDSGELLDALYEHVIRESGVEKMIIGAWPEGVTMHTRQNEESIYLFFENYSSESRRVKGLGEFVDVESGQSGEGSIEIEGYGIRILKKCMENF